MFANFSELRSICELCQRMATYTVSVDILYRFYTKRGNACQFRGPHNVGKQTFLGKYVYTMFLKIITHEFWPSWTSPPTDRVCVYISLLSCDPPDFSSFRSDPPNPPSRWGGSPPPLPTLKGGPSLASARLPPFGPGHLLGVLAQIVWILEINFWPNKKHQQFTFF